MPADYAKNGSRGKRVGLHYGTLRAFSKVATFKLNGLHTEDFLSVTRIREVGLTPHLVTGTTQALGYSYLRMRTQTYIAMGNGLKSTLSAALIIWAQTSLKAQPAGPSLVDTNLAVRAVTTNLTRPTSMAFIGANDILVLEKASGKVQRVVDGTITSTVLDLPVNSASERGLLGIAQWQPLARLAVAWGNLRNLPPAGKLSVPSSSAF